jgi:hypothetical protein
MLPASPSGGVLMTLFDLDEAVDRMRRIGVAADATRGDGDTPFCRATST